MYVNYVIVFRDSFWYTYPIFFSQLTTPFTLGSAVQPITLAAVGSEPTLVTVSGWGTTAVSLLIKVLKHQSCHFCVSRYAGRRHCL